VGNQTKRARVSSADGGDASVFVTLALVLVPKAAGGS
jgi:hypothetical protein